MLEGGRGKIHRKHGGGVGVEDVNTEGVIVKVEVGTGWGGGAAGEDVA